MNKIVDNSMGLSLKSGLEAHIEFMNWRFQVLNKSLDTYWGFNRFIFGPVLEIFEGVFHLPNGNRMSHKIRHKLIVS